MMPTEGSGAKGFGFVLLERKRNGDSFSDPNDGRKNICRSVQSVHQFGDRVDGREWDDGIPLGHEVVVLTSVMNDKMDSVQYCRTSTLDFYSGITGSFSILRVTVPS